LKLFDELTDEDLEQVVGGADNMKNLMWQWKKYLNESIFHVSIDQLIPTEELGHGKKHDCPSQECEKNIQIKMDQIGNGLFKPIEVCNQKPIVTARLQGDKNYSPAPKSGQDESFYYVLDGHHRLEAAKRMGVKKIPVIKIQK